MQAIAFDRLADVCADIEERGIRAIGHESLHINVRILAELRTVDAGDIEAEALELPADEIVKVHRLALVFRFVVFIFLFFVFERDDIAFFEAFADFDFVALRFTERYVVALRFGFLIA